MQSQMSGVKPIVSEVVIVLDKSTSMNSVREATINGFNEFLDKQRVEGGDCYISLYQFSDAYKYQAVYEGQPVATAPKLTYNTFVPDGWTALHDAMGLTLRTMILRITDPTRRVVFLTITDGGENASKQFNAGQVRALVKEAEGRGWQMLYIGANQDAVLTAHGFGIGAQGAMTYAPNNAGTLRAFQSASASTAVYTSGVAANAVFSDADKKAQEDLIKGVTTPTV